MKRTLLAVLLLLTTTAFAPAQAGPPTFSYVVTAVDVNGFESVNSNEVSATFLKVPASPPATGMYQQHIVDLAWTAPVVPPGNPAIAGYNVYRGMVAGGPYTQINAALVTGVTYTDSFPLPPAPSGLTKAVR